MASSDKCSCKKRIGYAIQSHRLNPGNLEYSALEMTDQYVRAMEEMDAQSEVFAHLPRYRSPKRVRDFLQKILASEDMETILQTMEQ